MPLPFPKMLYISSAELFIKMCHLKVIFVEFEVVTVVTEESAIICDETQCIPVEVS